MSITVLAGIIAPNSIWSASVGGRQIRSNARAINQGGHQQINIVRARTIRSYEFGTVPIREDGSDPDSRIQVWQELEGLHEVTEGGAYGFLVLDPKDCTAHHGSGKVELVSDPSNTYQMLKTYTSVGSVLTKDRRITRPRAATITVQIAGVPTGAFTLNEDTGVLTIPASPVAADVTWAGTFYVPVHFSTDEIDWDLLIAGPTGTRYVAAPNVTLMEVLE